MSEKKTGNKISVIVPVYNVEKYLRKCVDSILNQTYQNLEIILVDDGSPDTCPAICDEYAQMDERVRVIHKKNGGLSDARNTGIDASTGDYISFIDSDDYIDHQMMQCLYEKIVSDKSDMVICGYEFVTEDGKILRNDTSISPIQEGLLTNIEACRKLQEHNWWFYVTAVNKLYSRALFQVRRFPVGIIHEDQAIIHHIFYDCKKISTISRCLYFYLQRNNSIMGMGASTNRLYDVLALYDRIQFYKDKRLVEFVPTTVEQLFQKYSAVRPYIIENSKEETQLVKQADFIVKELSGEWKVSLSLRETILLKHPKFYCFLRNYLLLYRNTTRRISLICEAIKIRLQISKCREKSPYKRAIIFISTPTHGNLGDHAIVKAQYDLLKSMGLEHAIFELAKEDFYKLARFHSFIIQKKDLIIIDGGGSIGTLWIQEENNMRDILQKFSNNPIVIFPQTAYFENTDFGKEELKKTVGVYQQHHNLVVFCRDSATLHLFEQYFINVEYYYVPDIVLSLKPEYPADIKRRNGVALCLRTDKERIVSQDLVISIKEFLLRNGKQFTEISTVERKRIDQTTREMELKNKWRQFQSAEFIITDRLHGMIFSAITGTPCIVMDNISGKVKNSYFWIKYLPYVHFVNDEKELFRWINYLCKNHLEGEYDPSPLDNHYQKIKDSISKKLSGK